MTLRVPALLVLGLALPAGPPTSVGFAQTGGNFRRARAREVGELVGTCERSVTRRTDCLVIGGLPAGDWSQEGLGAQVREAVRLRTRGASIAVVSEDHWVTALP